MRRKFPSDHRPWFRCLTDILHDEKLNGGCPPAVAWAYIRLLAMLQQTGSRDGKISLDHRALAFLTCRAQHRHALSIARALEEHSLCTLSARGVHVELTVSKWAEIQGFAPPLRVEESRVDKKPPLSPPKAPTPKVSRKRKTPCPETLDEKQWARVLAWRDEKHPEFGQEELTAQWELHHQHHGAKGNLAIDWVLSFYNWLTGPYYKRATASGTAAAHPRVPAYEPPAGPRLWESVEDGEHLADEFSKLRKTDMPRRRLVN